MAPPSIAIGIGLSATPGGMGQEAPPPVQLTPAAGFTASTAGGTIDVTVTSPAIHAGTYSVAAADLAAGPVALVPPTVQPASVTVGETVSGLPGLWASATTHAPPAVTRQWLRDGTAISGATGPDHLAQPADIGGVLTLRETATQPGLGAAAALSVTQAGVTAAPGRTVVFSLIGQSNMVGWAPFDGGAPYPAGTLQVARANRASGGAEGALVPAAPLLDHHDGSASFMGLALQFARDWAAANPGDTLVLVPDAKGSTGFAAGHWTPGGSYYATAVARLNTLFAANPDFEMGGFLWHQGESDAGSAADAAAYAGALDAMIAQIRADVSAADAATPFILGGMVPSWVAGDPDRQTVQATLQATPQRVAHTAFADSAGLSAQADGIHFNAASLRSLGSGYHAALAAAATNGADWQIAGSVLQAVPAIPAPAVSGTIVTAGA